MNNRGFAARSARIAFPYGNFICFWILIQTTVKPAKKMDEYRKKYEELKAQYEASYGPLNENRSKTSRWDWVTSPWPWEIEEDDE